MTICTAADGFNGPSFSSGGRRGTSKGDTNEGIDSPQETLKVVNTSRGALVDTGAVIAALKSRQLGYLAIDVYEQESSLFLHDHSADITEDDVFQLSFSEDDCTSSLGWPPCVRMTPERDVSEVLCTTCRERSGVLRSVTYTARQSRKRRKFRRSTGKLP